MIEIRNFEGDAGELVTFLHRVWKASFADRVLCPLWSQQEMNWQFFHNPHAERDYMVAVYDKARLVGTLFAMPTRFKSKTGEFDGSCGSWMSVDPEYRKQFVAMLMIEEMQDRHLERHASCLFGFAFETGQPMGFEFWQKFYRLRPDELSEPLRIGFMIRVLNARHAAAASLTMGDRLLSRVAGAMTPSPRFVQRPVGGREYRSSDLTRCLALVEQLSDGVDFGYKWSAERLAHHLQYKNVPTTLVYEVNGRLEGWINYYRLEVLGRRPFLVAIIDNLVFGDLSFRDRKAFIYWALQRMAEDGAVLAVAIRLPLWPIGTLLSAGFVPQNLGYHLLYIRTDPNFTLKLTPNFYLHLR